MIDKPRVILHNQISVNGQVSGFEPDLQLHYSLAERFNHQAHLVGSKTIIQALADAEKKSQAPGAEPGKGPSDNGMAQTATAKADSDDKENGKPWLVVPDSNGRVSDWTSLVEQPYWCGVIVAVSQATPSDYIQKVEAAGAKVIVAGAERVDLAALLRVLNESYGVETVLLDSGGKLNGAMLRAGLIHELSLIVVPVLAGPQVSSGFLEAIDVFACGRSVDVRLMSVEELEDQRLWLHYEVALREITQVLPPKQQ